jgi:tetratricopeptide (TPR) repeat protein
MQYQYWQFALMIVLFLSYISLIIYYWFKDRRKSFWLAWFLVVLSPTLTPLGVSWIVAERYGYLAVLGVFVFVSSWILKLFKKKETQIWGYFLIIVIVIGLITRTVIRNRDWLDQDALWIASERCSPNSPQNNNNLGDLYGRRKQWDKAIYHFSRAIEIKPNYADAFHNLGNTFVAVKDYDRALAAYNKTLEINPKIWQTYQQIFILFYNNKDFDKANEVLEKAFDNGVENSKLYALKAVLLMDTGEIEEAKKWANKSLEVNPEEQLAKDVLKKARS